jgi:mono/diheme cytochrome c family protein
MSPIESSSPSAGILWARRIRHVSLLIWFLLMVLTFSACGTSSSGATFDPDAGQHAANWVNPLAIGCTDFHAGPIKAVQADSRGPVLFGMRCGICHGNGGVGKIGPDIRGADVAIITGAIAVIPLMKGQANLSSDDIQAIAAYLATLRAGAQPATSVIQTDNCVSCHGNALDGGIAQRTCFSCHNGPDGSVGHPAAWGLAVTDPINFHGSYGGMFSNSCTTCHGVNFEGAIGQSCASCHNGTIAPVLDFIPVLGQPGGQAATIITALNGNQEVQAKELEVLLRYLKR